MLHREEIEKRFGYHKPTDTGAINTVLLHQQLRVAFKDFAQFLVELAPAGRALAVALTELEDASMWAHKAVAEIDPVSNE